MAAVANDDSRRRIETMASNLLLEALAGEAVEMFRTAGIRSVLLRGVTTARWLYEDGSRAYGDVDLLVASARFDEGERLLEAMGLERSAIERAFAEGSPGHASTWVRESATIDLHRTLVGVGVSAEQAWSALSGNTEIWTVGRSEVEVLNPAGRSLILALHVAHHGPGVGRTKEDLERAIAGVPTPTWLGAATLARRLEAESSMAAGLLSVRGGQGLCDALGLRLDGEVAVDGSTSFHTAQGLLWLARTNGIRAKVRYTKIKLFPPPEVMRGRVASARAGRIALTWAYGVRLVRIGWHAPAAVRGLARVRRERRSPS